MGFFIKYLTRRIVDIDSRSFAQQADFVQKIAKDPALASAIQYFSEEVIIDDKPLYGIYKALEALTAALGKDGRTALGNLAGQGKKYVDDVMQTAQITRHHDDPHAKQVLTDAECKERARTLIAAYAENESRYNIIKATNSQTVIAPASLRATDPIHRDIEDYLRTYDIYYDRRKNFYKNQGKPMKNIIGVPQLAQAVEAIVLQRPDTARARPSSLIKDDSDYQKLFNREYPIQAYKASVEIIKATEAFLSKHTDLTAVEKNDLKYYVAMIVSTNLVGAVSPTVEQIAALEGKAIDDDYFQRAYELAKEQYVKLGATDTVAKGSDMISGVKTELGQGRLF